MDFDPVLEAARKLVDDGATPACQLAVALDKRLPDHPNVPTFKEAGADFTSDGWVGYVAVAATPKPIMDKLNAAFVKAVQAPAVRQRLTEMGYVVSGTSPEEFTAVVREATKRYSEVIKAGQIKLD